MSNPYISPFAKPVYVMLKPVGSVCNLACEYCYYLEKGKLYPEVKNHIMSEQLLEKFIKEYLECQTMPQDVYDVVHGQTDETDMIYDLVITQTEGMHYYDAVCVRNGSVYALVLDKHFKEEKKEYETFMQQALANSKYKYIVHLYTDTDAFAKKIHSIGEPNDKTKLIDQYMREQILTFCV